MSLKTEDEAKGTTCHRSMAGSIQWPCIGAECMAWRWTPLMTSPEWIAAVKQAAAEIGDTTPSRAKAASAVVDDPAKYGLPNKPYQGYCGLVGKPEVL